MMKHQLQSEKLIKETLNETRGLEILARISSCQAFGARQNSMEIVSLALLTNANEITSL